MKIEIPKKKNLKFIEKFFENKNLGYLIKLSKKRKSNVNNVFNEHTHLPDLNDLYRLYQFILLNKRTTIFEFGSGWSTLIFTLALQELKNNFYKEVKNLRRNNPFELFVLENEKKYLNITKKRIKNFYFNEKTKNTVKVNYFFSDVEMTLFNNRICTQYKKLPICSPDFIYVDGPGQFSVKNNINGISTRHKDMMPMICDILKLEYFYTPGTIIVCDGRSANASFLRNNFERNWDYYNDYKNDQHIFLLNEKMLGKYNKLQLEFYNKKY